MNKTIYPSRSHVANKVFSEITDLHKLLIIPVDFAKQAYIVQFCLGTGDFRPTWQVIQLNALFPVAHA